MLYLYDQNMSPGPHKRFHFINCVVESTGYNDVVKDCWNNPMAGIPSYVLWNKLKRLRLTLCKINKSFLASKHHIDLSRDNLSKAQDDLAGDLMNTEKIWKVKNCTETLLKWNDIYEAILRQRAKIQWLKDGDGCTAFFHVYVKSKQPTKALNMLQKDGGSYITSQKSIEEEILNFYGSLMGKGDDSLDYIDIRAMRNGAQLQNAQREFLVALISNDEIYDAPKRIKDIASPGLDGYSAKFSKSSWNIMKEHVIAIVKEFFDWGKLYKAFNCTLVFLIPKFDSASSVKDYRPILVCTTVYIIISRIMTKRLSRVMGSIISTNQAAFILGRKSITTS